jgi:chemotaxis methyl-accepting protein methylase
MNNKQMNNEQFSQLLDYFFYSWAGYQKAKKGVKKRIARHMEALGCRDVDDYIARLEADPGLRSECERRMSVPVSRFFRDREVWEILEKDILPRFFDKKAVRVWSAGCAGGEEVYSFKILWHMLGEKYPGLPELKVAASDLNPENLARAKKGLYPASSFKETAQDIRDRFFEKGPTRKLWAIQSFLKNGIEWHRLNLIHDPPPLKNCDIIFVRNNILLYASECLKQSGFEKIAAALKDDGFLVVGTKDALPKETAGFEKIKLPYLFQKDA